MSKKPIFKEGDKVFITSHGWLTILRYSNTLDGVHYYIVKELDRVYISEKTMSFTEYELKGFTQERPIDWNDYMGEWGFFWDNEDHKFLQRLMKFNLTNKYRFHRAEDGVAFENFQPLTPELKELLIKQGIINE